MKESAVVQPQLRNHVNMIVSCCQPAIYIPRLAVQWRAACTFCSMLSRSCGDKPLRLWDFYLLNPAYATIRG
jgi:hypothetical protein